MAGCSLSFLRSLHQNTAAQALFLRARSCSAHLHSNVEPNPAAFRAIPPRGRKAVQGIAMQGMHIVP